MWFEIKEKRKEWEIKKITLRVGVDSFIIINEHRKNGKKKMKIKFAKYFFIFVASALQVICLHVFFWPNNYEKQTRDFNKQWSGVLRKSISQHVRVVPRQWNASFLVKSYICAISWNFLFFLTKQTTTNTTCTCALFN